MKKILSILLVLGVVFCLTGCGLGKPSTLDCTQKISFAEIELTANFVGKKVTSMSMKYDMDLSKYSDSIVNTMASQDYCTSVQKRLSQYTLADCSQTVENKHIILKSGIDINNIKKTQLIGSPEATKVELEKQGYTCTLK